MSWNVPEYSSIFQHKSGVFQNIAECSSMFHNIPVLAYARMFHMSWFQNILACFGISRCWAYIWEQGRTSPLYSIQEDLKSGIDKESEGAPRGLWYLKGAGELGTPGQAKLSPPPTHLRVESGAPWW